MGYENTVWWIKCSVRIASGEDMWQPLVHTLRCVPGQTYVNGQCEEVCSADGHCASYVTGVDIRNLAVCTSNIRPHESASSSVSPPTAPSALLRIQYTGCYYQNSQSLICYSSILIRNWIVGAGGTASSNSCISWSVHLRVRTLEPGLLLLSSGFPINDRLYGR
jgi:hypothetical protein